MLLTGWAVSVFIYPQTPVASRAHIRSNAEAANLLRQANDAVIKANWVQAVALCQRVIESYAAYAVPLIEDGGRESAVVFQGARYAALETLRAMPPAGRRAYQQLFDAPAKKLFDAVSADSQQPTANSLASLAHLADRYLFSSYGAKAIDILGAYYLEKGDTYSAARYLNRIHWLYAEPEIPKTIRSNLALLEKWTTTTVPNVFGAYGGDNSHNTPAQSTITALPGFISSFPDDRTPSPLVPPPPNPNIFNLYERPFAYSPEIFLSYFPVVSGSRVYLPSAATVYAFDIADKKNEPMPLSSAVSSVPSATLWPPDWKMDIPKDDTVTPMIDDRIIYTASVSGKYLYLPLVTGYETPEIQLGMLPVKYAFANRTLFCFDTTTGKIVWSCPEGFGKRPNSQLAKVSFGIAPAVEGNVLYVAGINMPKQTDLPEHYVYCLDAITGAVRWSSFIASGLLETNLFNNLSREPIGSAITVDRDTLYYCSHIGVAAALDKYDGAVKWITHYPQHHIPPVRQDYTPKRLPLQWINNPVVVTGTQVFVTPIDSPYLLSLSAEDGKELWRWDGAELGGTRYVLGVRNNLLVVSGLASVSCLNIDKQGKREWVIYNKPFRGKGVLTKDRAYIPCLDGLIDIDLKTGKINNSYPWAKPQYSGNLILTPGYLITASAGYLNLFSLTSPPPVSPK